MRWSLRISWGFKVPSLLQAQKFMISHSFLNLSLKVLEITRRILLKIYRVYFTQELVFSVREKWSLMLFIWLHSLKNSILKDFWICWVLIDRSLFHLMIFHVLLQFKFILMWILIDILQNFRFLLHPHTFMTDLLLVISALWFTRLFACHHTRFQIES